MKKLKIMTVLGTRPEIIRLSEVIKLLNTETEHLLVHTGQNYDYELNQIFFEDLGLRKPDYFLSSAGKTSCATVGDIITKVDDIIKKELPDAVLVLGDTNSGMSAYAAKRNKVPIFHMEAGNRCFDMRVPEEINRRIIDHVSDINLVYSDLSRTNLLNEGISLDRIFKTGSPLYEVIVKNKEKIESSSIMSDLKLTQNDYFVLSLHREENISLDVNFDKIIAIIDKIIQEYDKEIIFSVHPRTRKKIDEKKVKFNSKVKLMNPLGLFDYLKLQKSALCVISDSGTISEEASILKFPAINMRETHERFEAMDESSVIMIGLNQERVIQAIDHIMNTKSYVQNLHIPEDYSVDNVSVKTVRIIMSYIDYVNRVVWSK